MCYNKSVIQKLGELQKQYELFKPVNEKDAFDELPLYNALRLQKLPIIAERDGKLHAFKALWWLIPHWSASGKPEVTAFNARVETVDKSRLFAPYFKSSRCLIPVGAFYEYSADEIVEIEINGKLKRVKQPYLVRMKNNEPFALAGIFSVWVDKKTGEELPTYSVLTTEPNEVIGRMHDRMPVILDKRNFKMWLDPEYQDTEKLKKIIQESYPASRMKAEKVNAE